MHNTMLIIAVNGTKLMGGTYVPGGFFPIPRVGEKYVHSNTSLGVEKKIYFTVIEVDYTFHEHHTEVTVIVTEE